MGGFHRVGIFLIRFWVFDLWRRFLRRFRHWERFDIIVVVRVSSVICTVQSISSTLLVWKKTHLVVFHSTSRLTSLTLEVQIDRRGQLRHPLQWRTSSTQSAWRFLSYSVHVRPLTSRNCCSLVKSLTCISNECVAQNLWESGGHLSVHLVVEMAKNYQRQGELQFER